ncbi:hypothetical protein ABZ553_27665 [Streptomyces sparsogenes]|uniref:hypothetical protein n=1 Tax=Streptomyces sparsogenes TaxID=67365 RepID=UPI003404121F
MIACARRGARFAVRKLAEALLGEESIQIYGAEAWAKFAGASDYDQVMDPRVHGIRLISVLVNGK